MTTEVTDSGTVRPEHLLEYNKKAFKLVGLCKDGIHTTMPWTPIFEGPNYWTDEKLVQASKNGLFRYGVATVFGRTRLVDGQGPLYLNNLDVDSDTVHDKLFILQDPVLKYSLYSLIQKVRDNTFVVKTRKPKGFQIYWLSHKQHNAIRTEYCKEDCKFEIKTDKSSGHATLPPSRHRNDPNFEYKSCGGSELFVSDDLYDTILEVLKDCLKPRPEKALNDYQIQSGEQNSSPSGETKQDSGNGKSDELIRE